MCVRGHARDLITGPDGQAVTAAEDHFEIMASSSREILSIQTSRCNERAQELVGSRGGGHLRGKLADLFPQELAAGTPLHQVLDDFSGASLVAGAVWLQWDPQTIERIRAQGTGSTAGRNGKMEGVCTGFAPGSSALSPDRFNGGVKNFHLTRVQPLENPDDPQGWHALGEQEGPSARRARWIDVWLEGVLRIEAGFQDSCTMPDGSRGAVHEYLISATADPQTHELLSLEADPRVLPFGECPAAILNIGRLVGAPLPAFRKHVLDQLPGTLGCTHLNDVLRALADTPQLARRLV